MSRRRPAIHSVHIYKDDPALIARLCGIVSSSLNVGDAVLIIASQPHREDLVRQLTSAGLILRPHAREGRFTMLDAQATLESFMGPNGIDSDRFMASVGVLLGAAHAAARSRSQGLTVFGEMVALLWARGDKETALQLETLWNDLLGVRAFHLHCAYPSSAFSNTEEEAAVSNTHSHLVTQ